MIKDCTCIHSYQDRVYGFARRVHNPCYTKGRVTGHRCTVCGEKKEKGYTAPDVDVDTDVL